MGAAGFRGRGPGATMTTLSFTPNLFRHVESPGARIEDDTVREVLEFWFVRCGMIPVAGNGWGVGTTSQEYTRSYLILAIRPMLRSVFR